MVLFMLMLCHVCDPPVTHVRTIAICAFVLDVLCHVCDAHVSHACAPRACSQQLVAQATRPALIMATRVSGTRDENFYDELIAGHVHVKPRLKAQSWRSLEPAAVAAAWSGLLTEVASSGVKLHIATFSSRLDKYHGACNTHKLFAEAMQKALSHCRSKCKGSRIQNYSDFGSKQPKEVQQIMAALMKMKKSPSTQSLSSGAASQGDDLMDIADSDEEKTLPCKTSPAKMSCTDEVLAFYSKEANDPSSSSSCRKLVPVVSVCSSPGKSAKAVDSDVEDGEVDLQFHITCKRFVWSAAFTNHTPPMDQTIIAHVPRASNCYCEIDAQTLTMHALSQSQKCLRCIGHATPMPNACTCHSSALALVVYRLQRWVQETSCQWITQPWKPSGLQREARQGHL